MKHVVFFLIMGALIGACAKENLVQPGAIQVTPDTLSIEERRHELLRADLESALAYLNNLRADSLATRSAVVGAAQRLRSIENTLISAMPDSTLASIADQVTASLAARSATMWPALRARWVELLPGELWLRGMATRQTGRALVLVHPDFCDPERIVDVECLLHQELYDLHFAEVCYQPLQVPGGEMCFLINVKQAD